MGKIGKALEEDRQGAEQGPEEGQGEADASAGGSVKDWPSTLMYLRPELAEELEVVLARLRIQYKREHGSAPGRNRDLYRAVVRAALDNLDDVKAELGLEQD